MEFVKGEAEELVETLLGCQRDYPGGRGQEDLCNLR